MGGIKYLRIGFGAIFSEYSGLKFKKHFPDQFEGFIESNFEIANKNGKESQIYRPIEMSWIILEKKRCFLVQIA